MEKSHEQKQADIKSDIAAWANGTLSTPGRKSGGEPNKTAADIEKWSASFNQNNK